MIAKLLFLCDNRAMADGKYISISPSQGGMDDQLKDLMKMEKNLLEKITSAIEELQWIDTLNQEQRAEIHTILEAMKHDCESHIEIILSLLGKGKEIHHVPSNRS